MQSLKSLTTFTYKVICPRQTIAHSTNTHFTLNALFLTITSTFSWRFTISIARFFLKISLRSRDSIWERFDSLANPQLPLWDKYSTLEHFRSQEIFFWSDGQKRFESSVLKSKVHLEQINENCQKWTKLSQQTCLTLSLLSHDGKPHLISPQHFSEDSKA